MSEPVDLAIVGAGPAGLAAAATAVELGLKTVVIDEQTEPGGQIYRAIETAAPAVLAADSIDQGSRPLRVPDFRPSADRPAGQMPKET